MRPGTGMAMPPPQTGMRTAVGTSAGASAAGFGGGIREGKFTEQIYSMIRDQKYQEAIAVLSTKVLEFPNSRAATSLLAYCYYYVGDFQQAIGLYERLTKLCPDNDEYKFHYAQARPSLPPRSHASPNPSPSHNYSPSYSPNYSPTRQPNATAQRHSPTLQPQPRPWAGRER